MCSQSLLRVRLVAIALLLFCALAQTDGPTPTARRSLSASARRSLSPSRFPTRTPSNARRTPSSAPTPNNCRVALVAGGGAPCANALGGQAGFSGTGGILALPPTGNPAFPSALLYTDSGSYSIRNVSIDNSFLGQVGLLSGDALCSTPGGTDASEGLSVTWDSPAGLAALSGDYGGAYSGYSVAVVSTSHTLRLLNRVTGGTLTTAGQHGVAGIVDGVGTAALFNSPSAVTVDGSNVMFVADTSNHAIRRVSFAASQFTTLTVVGSTAGAAGYGYADGVGTAALFYNPVGIVSDGATFLYVTDKTNKRVRRIAAGTWAVTTLAGSGTLSSVDGLGTSATFSYLFALAYSATENALYTMDARNLAGGTTLIRRIGLGGSNPVTRIAGGGSTTVNAAAGRSSVACAAANFNSGYSSGLAIDARNRLYFVDSTSTARLLMVQAQPITATAAAFPSRSASARPSPSTSTTLTQTQSVTRSGAPSARASPSTPPSASALVLASTPSVTPTTTPSRTPTASPSPSAGSATVLSPGNAFALADGARYIGVSAGCTFTVTLTGGGGAGGGGTTLSNGGAGASFAATFSTSAAFTARVGSGGAYKSAGGGASALYTDAEVLAVAGGGGGGAYAGTALGGRAGPPGGAAQAGTANGANTGGGGGTQAAGGAAGSGEACPGGAPLAGTGFSSVALGGRGGNAGRCTSPTVVAGGAGWGAGGNSWIQVNYDGAGGGGGLYGGGGGRCGCASSPSGGGGGSSYVGLGVTFGTVTFVGGGAMTGPGGSGSAVLTAVTCASSSPTPTAAASPCAAGTVGAPGGPCAPCPGGHFCPAGTTSTARQACGRGSFCPDGSAAPRPCPIQLPPAGGWGAQLVQGPAFVIETAHCLNHCFWNFTAGADGLLSKC